MTCGSRRLTLWALLTAAICAAAMVAVSLTSPAAAQTAPEVPLTDEFSAADQYVESVPTARGPKVPGVGRKRAGRATLPADVQESLAGQPRQTAAKLELIATSPDLGAPVEAEAGSRRSTRRGSPRVPAATVSAAAEGEQDTLLWLLISLLAITGLAAGTAAYRHHRHRNQAG